MGYETFAKDNGDDLSSGKRPPAQNPEPGTGPDDGDKLG